MQKIYWTEKANNDLLRLYEFLLQVNPKAAINVVNKLTTAPDILLEHCRIGEQLFEYEPREVRKLLVGKYEMHYEIQNDNIIILCIWHAKENR
ncbi:MAG: type II toxin-antitoxin system RelE/ParE family toxin [Cardiobacteriaceae bacterium]|nr:type II toxin-antitoxin system RelE/ParE family toxin [Cardiobacteriaceae bacterium]